MASVGAEVKRWLQQSHRGDDTNALHKAFTILKAYTSEKHSQPIPSELPIMCCEEAVRLKLWDMAKECITLFSPDAQSSKALDSRALYCEGLVQSHFIADADTTSQEYVEARHTCASLVIRGITLGMEEWPRDSWIVVKGVDVLWDIIKPLYYAGNYRSVADIVLFVFSLYERFMIGGGYSHIQWSVRYTTCLRGCGRHQEAVDQLSTSIDSAVYLKNERLQIQLYRLSSVISVETAAKSGKSSDGNNYQLPKSAIHQAVFISQLVLCRSTDSQSAKQDLSNAFDRLLGGPEATRSSKPSKSAKQHVTESEISDPDVLEEILSDVVLGVALCLKEDARVDETVQKLLRSPNARSRTFAVFAKTVAFARKEGLLDLYSALDASYLTPTMSRQLTQCIKEVETALYGARTIEDTSERHYTVQVGCALLWTYCLPLLQPSTHAKLRHLLHRMSEDLGEIESFIPWLQTCVEYECCLAEFNEDSLSLAKQRADDALTRGYEETKDDGIVIYPMDFPIRWLQHRIGVHGALDGSTLASAEDQALYNLEQSIITPNESKRLVLLKAAFNKLPPLAVPLPAPSPEEISIRESRSKSAAGNALSAHAERPPRRALAQLYFMMLQECRRDMAPSLVPIATAVAEALCDMCVSADGPNLDTARIRAEAHLFLAEVLILQEQTASKSVSEEEKQQQHDRISKYLVTAAEMGSVIATRGEATAWITINACQLYLDWKSPSFLAGKFEGAVRHLAVLYSFYGNLGIDYTRESRLTIDISLMLILSYLHEYVTAKGEVDGELTAGSYQEFVKKVLCYPKTESNNTFLKRALEVSNESQQRIVSPSQKTYILLLHPCICRLLSTQTRVDTHASSQELLLQLLGRMSGPISKEEKLSLLNKDAMDYLVADPAVPLCGRVALFAEELRQESTVLAVCSIADKLYVTGKLGWANPQRHAPTGSRAAAAAAAAAQNQTAQVQPTAPPPHPKPTAEEWFWYARLLRSQASIYESRSQAVDRASAESLGIKVLVLCTNSAIAASHSHDETRFSQIVSALLLYYKTIVHLRAGACDTSLLIPSLEMNLTKQVLVHLANPPHDKANQLFTILSSMGLLLLRCLADAGRLKEGLDSLSYLRSILPTRHQSQFSVLEMQFATQLGLGKEAIAKRLATADPETEALVWMSVAQQASKRSDCIDAWQLAIAAVKSSPVRQANCILEMAQQLSQWGDYPTKGIRTMLHSALALVETGSSSHAASTHTVDALRQLSDKRSQTLPCKMIGTLTGKSLFLTSTSRLAKDDKSISLLKRNFGNANMKDVTLAVSIVYLLFTIAPRYRRDATDTRMTKREYAMLIIHYVECFWRLCAQYISDTDGVHDLALPSEFGDWFGFFVDDVHIKALTASNLLDRRHNTESMQGLLFRVAEYLIGEGIPHFTFVIYSWIYLAACLRYRSGDVRIEAVQRATNAKAALAGIYYGAGKSGEVYDTVDPQPRYWYAIQQCLSETHTSVEMVSWVHCNVHQGKLHDVLLFEADTLLVLGQVQDAMLIADMVSPFAEKIKDYDAMSLCVIIKATSLFLQGQPKEAHSLLSDEASMAANASPNTWLRWHLLNLRVLHAQNQPLKALSYITALQSECEVIARRTPSGSVAKDIADDISGYMLDAVDIDSIALFGTAVVPQEFYSARGDECVKRLAMSTSVLSRAQASYYRRQNHMRFSPMDSRDMSSALDAFRELCEERDAIASLLEEIRQQIAEVQPTTLSSTRAFGRSHLRVTESRLLQMHAENAEERLQLAEHVQQVYRWLTMEELRVPRGEGPQELEKHVLEYIRDPTIQCYEQYHMRVLQEWCAPVHEWHPEMLNAFDHFGIPEAVRERVSRFSIQAILHSAGEVVSHGSPAFYDVMLQMLDMELQRTLESSFELCSPIDVSLLSRRHDMLSQQWCATPLTVLEKPVAGRRRSVSDRRHKKDAQEPRPEVRKFTEKEGAILENLQSVINNAQQRFDFARLSRCYSLLGNFYMLLEHPNAACHAMEFALAAKLHHCLLDAFNTLVEDTTEGFLWRRMRYLLDTYPDAVNSVEYTKLRDELLSISPMFKRLELAADWPKDPDSPPVAPAAVDGTCLSIFVTDSDPSSAVVILRHVDGTVDYRMRTIDRRVFENLAMGLEVINERSRHALLTENAPKEEELAAYLAQLNEALQPILGEFDDMLVSLAAVKTPLYLCLDPLLQPLPLEHTALLSKFASIQREVSMTAIIKKLLQKLVKLNAPLYVIDPFGENEMAVETVLGSEPKAKANYTVLTCSQGSFPFAPSYLCMTMESQTIGAIVFDVCGRLTSILPPCALASMKLDHIQAVLITSDGVNEASVRREQKSVMAGDAGTDRCEEKWMVSLMLMLRGARFISTTWYPATPAAQDTLCKRTVPSVLNPRGVSETSASSGKGKEGKEKKDNNCFISYGVRALPAKSK